MADAFVAEARRWAGLLLQREHRGPGDTVEAAMWRASQRWDIEHSVFYSLRYRPPRDMLVGVYMRLKAAYEAECERQEAKLAHELMLARLAGIDETNSDTFREAQDLLRKTESQP